MTHRHDWDEQILERVIGGSSGYVGLIGSLSKWARFQQRLLARGVSRELLDRVTCPIGEPVGGKAPQEIAIGVARELLQAHFARTRGRHASERATPRRAAALLCGGRSERAGFIKALYPVEGQPWIARQLTALLESGVSDVTVGLGFHAREIQAALAATSSSLAPRIRTVVNSRAELGPFTTLQACLRAMMGSPPEGVFVLPIDTPAPTDGRLYQALAGRCDAGEAVAAVPESGDRSGHPVYLKWGLCEEILRLDPLLEDSRLDRVLKRYRERVLRVAVNDPGVLLNLNEPGDWELAYPRSATSSAPEKASAAPSTRAPETGMLST